MSDPDKSRGLYNKYHVERVGGALTKEKHKNCEMFVLDLNHDQYSLTALAAYAEACRLEYPLLAKDLFDTLEFYRVHQDKTRAADYGEPV